MNYIKEIVKEAYKENRVICICLKRIDWDKRLIGFIRNNFSDEHIKLEILNEYGEPKNIKDIPLSKIRSLEYGGVYNDNLEILYKGKFKSNRSKAKYIIWNRKEDLTAILKKLLKNEVLCTFYFNDYYSIGIIAKEVTDQLFINNKGYDGVNDGVSGYDINKLTKIRYNSPFELRIEFLLKNKSAS